MCRIWDLVQPNKLLLFFFKIKIQNKNSLWLYKLFPTQLYLHFCFPLYTKPPLSCNLYSALLFHPVLNSRTSVLYPSPPLHCNCSARITTSPLPVDKLSRSILSLQLTQSLGSTYTADRSLFLKRILHLASKTEHSWFLPPGLGPLCWLLALGLLLLCLPSFPKQTSLGSWLHIPEWGFPNTFSNLNLIYTKSCPVTISNVAWSNQDSWSPFCETGRKIHLFSIKKGHLHMLCILIKRKGLSSVLPE